MSIDKGAAKEPSSAVSGGLPDGLADGLPWERRRWAVAAIFTALAMAVSSAAIASAVKIAATAHRLRSQGKPSGKPSGEPLLNAEEGPFAAVLSMDMLKESPGRDAVAASAAFTTGAPIPPDIPLHAAYARGPNSADFRLLPARQPID